MKSALLPLGSVLLALAFGFFAGISLGPYLNMSADAIQKQPQVAEEERPPPSTMNQEKGKLCFPATVPLLNRAEFPNLALRLSEYVRSHERSSKKKRSFRWVEIGSNKCFNAVQFLKAFGILNTPQLRKEYTVADSGDSSDSDSSFFRLEAHFVDPWDVVENTYTSANEGLADYQTCRNKIQKLKKSNIMLGEITIHRNYSHLVAQSFPDEYFDFVYIDALHTYKGCKIDIESWWPKVKPGGLFAGDDYGDAELSPVIEKSHPTLAELFKESRWGVVRAVNQFSQKQRLQVHTTALEGHYVKFLSNYHPHLSAPNWYLFKKDDALFDYSCTKVLVGNTYGWR